MRAHLSFYSGQLYGLEKFWAFLKYSRRKPKISAKLEEILKNYKRLEDFRVEGASFPQQFYPTKTRIKVGKHPRRTLPMRRLLFRLFQPRKQLLRQQHEKLQPEITVIQQACLVP